jgi:iron complex transport system substrate-binding protein
VGVTRTSTSTSPARAIGAGVLAVLLLVGAAACGSDSDSTDSSSARAARGDSGGSDGFPVTIEHTYDETTIEQRPERVVTVGLTDQDAVLALGVKPVGVTDWFGEQPHATWPWAQDELGDAEPEIVSDRSSIGFERIAELEPDLILAVYAGLTEDDYGTLSQIAPTVAQPDDYPDFGVPWDEQVLTVGRALGEAEQAESLVADVEARFAEARRAHPEFEGASALIVSPYAGNISVFAPHDPRGRFLEALGFEMPEEIGELAGDEFYAELSYERVDLIDVDALVVIVNSIETDPAELAAQPLYAELAVHRENREVFVENLDDVGAATTFVTVLSLPLLLDQLVPKLADAVAGNGGV